MTTTPIAPAESVDAPPTSGDVQIVELRARGLTYREIAHEVGVSESTIYRRFQSDELRAATLRARADHLAMVADTLESAAAAAADTLLSICKDESATDAARVRAAEAILSRTGFPASSKAEEATEADLKAVLLERIKAIRARAAREMTAAE